MPPPVCVDNLHQYVRLLLSHIPPALGLGIPALACRAINQKIQNSNELKIQNKERDARLLSVLKNKNLKK